MPVCVRTPPRPNPPARMRSMSVPCGTSSTSKSPAIICRWVSGLRPIWLTIALRRTFAATSLPIPLSGVAVSLAMTVRSRLPCRTISSTIRSGVPTPKNPPIITLAPSGIIRTVWPSEIVCISSLRERSLLRGPSAIDWQGCASDLSGCLRAEEDRKRSNLLWSGEFVRWLLFRQQFRLCGLDRNLFAVGALVDLFLYKRRQDPARANRIAGDRRRRRLQGNHFGQPDHTMLCSHVGALVGRCHQTMGRRHIDNAAPVSLSHFRQDGANGMKVGR